MTRPLSDALVFFGATGDVARMRAPDLSEASCLSMSELIN